MIAGAIGSAPGALDAALSDWAQWRDRDAAEIYWLAADFGAATPTPKVIVEATRLLERQGRAPDPGNVFQHRRRPSTVVTPPVLVKAARAAMGRPGADRGEIMRELRELIVTDTRRRRLNRKPEYVSSAEHNDAGKTEVREEVARMSEMTTVDVTVKNVVRGSPRAPGRRCDGAGRPWCSSRRPGPKEDWAQLVPATGEFARSLAPDFPGFGAADKPERFDYTSAGYAAHLNGILAQLGIEQVHLVMHDFGGAWGLL